MKILIDADIIAYRAAAACENEPVDFANIRADSMVYDILAFVDHHDRWYDEWSLYLTNGKNNFRNDIGVTAVYKGNRPSKKPKHLKAVKQHFVDNWGAVFAEGQEADDAIAIEATALNGDGIIASLDKDFKQVSGWHYNFIKRIHEYVNEEDAIRFFYKQILTGDTADNIIGLYKVGPVKAGKMLKDCATEKEMYDVCVAAYESEDRVLENARLLWLRRFEGQMWEPPKGE